MNKLIEKMRKDLIKVHNKYSDNKIISDGTTPLDIVKLFDFKYSNFEYDLSRLIELAFTLEGINEAFDDENSKELKEALQTLNHEIEIEVKKIGA